MAKREAQAQSILPPAGAPSALERAEQALAARVEAFAEASEALRAEIKAFDAALAGVEGRPAEPELRLVVSRETAEVEAIAEAVACGDVGDGDRPTPAQIAEFFRVHEQPGTPEPEKPARPEPAVATGRRPRNSARQRLYADIGGTIIGLSGATALINFVLLR